MDNNEYRPVFLRLTQQTDKAIYQNLIAQNNDLTIYDTIYSQLSEFVKINNPSKKLTSEESNRLITEHIGQVPLQEYGVWVFYPWSKRLVHLLDENEFIAVRTNRNLYKILPEEIQTLRTKKIGVIGLSVGQSIALTMATERICGAMHLADFDSIELGNMNRLQVGVHDMGTNKAILAARKIAELDPYIKVTCFEDGITAENIDDFFTSEGKIDILAEECDGIDVKILSRIKARQLGVPVVMDTNDNGMLDIERFDLEPQRPVLHGAVADLENLDFGTLSKKLKHLTIEEKIHYLSKIIGIENVSPPMLFSLGEMNKTITGWPQLASAVTLGAAMLTDVSRRILLGKTKESGRFFVDLEKLGLVE
ncbi:MAG: ThiF family adenylyltransferase [Niabella sp.]